jgi:hypothetical protein
MQTKDFPSVIAVKKSTEPLVEHYKNMMDTEQATPITSADITPAMHQEWNKIFVAEDMSFASPKDGEIMAAAVNAYMGAKK